MRAAARYADANLAVVILAGERYGTGSSRDWAAKGARMLGARAVLANSFERIHRANPIGMGVLPLRLPQGWHAATLRIAAGDTFGIHLDPAGLVRVAAFESSIVRSRMEIGSKPRRRLCSIPSSTSRSYAPAG